MMPTTNSGRAASPSVATDVVWSNALSRRLALVAPSRIPSGTLITAASTMRKSEYTSRSLSTSVTGRLFANDVPRSPVRTPEIHSQYWVSTGSSRPSC